LCVGVVEGVDRSVYFGGVSCLPVPATSCYAERKIWIFCRRPAIFVERNKLFCGTKDLDLSWAASSFAEQKIWIFRGRQALLRNKRFGSFVGGKLFLRNERFGSFIAGSQLFLRNERFGSLVAGSQLFLRNERFGSFVGGSQLFLRNESFGSFVAGSQLFLRNETRDRSLSAASWFCGTKQLDISSAASCFCGTKALDLSLPAASCFCGTKDLDLSWAASSFAERKIWIFRGRQAVFAERKIWIFRCRQPAVFAERKISIFRRRPAVFAEPKLGSFVAVVVTERVAVIQVDKPSKRRNPTTKPKPSNNQTQTFQQPNPNLPNAEACVVTPPCLYIANTTTHVTYDSKVLPHNAAYQKSQTTALPPRSTSC